MAHPYLNPAHPHNRARTSTPSASISQLSLDVSNPASARDGPLSDANMGSGFAQTIALPSFNAPSIDPEIASHSSGPERRRKRSTPSAPRLAHKKKSREGSQVGGQSASERGSSVPDDVLVPTRSYHFKSFEAFDSSAASVGAVPSGEGYTFAPSTNPEHVEPMTSNEAGPSTLPMVPQPKKTKSILSAGKRVMKEVLGGGGDKGPPTEGKAVYYGRGGQGGANIRSGKPSTMSTGSVAPTSTLPSVRAPSNPIPGSDRSSSYYTNSSAYTPSLLSSPYAESVASSPYATSVDDSSYYEPSSYSNRHTPSSLRPSTHPSPSHYTLSPVSLPVELPRKGSAASSHSGGGNPNGSYRLSPSPGYQRFQRQNSWVEGSFPRSAGPGTATSSDGSSYYGTSPRNDFSQMTQITANHTLGPIESAHVSAMSLSSHPQAAYLDNKRSLANRPSQTFSMGGETSNFAVPTSYQPPNQLQPSQTSVSNNQRSAGPANDDIIAQILGLVGMKPNDPGSMQSFGALEAASAGASPLDPTPDLSQRGLPDSLAKAVGHLSLIQNPLDSGWPRPPPPTGTVSVPRFPTYAYHPFGNLSPPLSMPNPSTTAWLGEGGPMTAGMQDVPQSQDLGYTPDPTGSNQMLNDLCEEAYLVQQQLAQRLAEIAAWERQQQSQDQDSGTFPPTT